MTDQQQSAMCGWAFEQGRINGEFEDDVNSELAALRAEVATKDAQLAEVKKDAEQGRRFRDATWQTRLDTKDAEIARLKGEWDDLHQSFMNSNADWQVEADAAESALSAAKQRIAELIWAVRTLRDVSRVGASPLGRLEAERIEAALSGAPTEPRPPGVSGDAGSELAPDSSQAVNPSGTPTEDAPPKCDERGPGGFRCARTDRHEEHWFHAAPTEDPAKEGA